MSLGGYQTWDHRFDPLPCALSQAAAIWHCAFGLREYRFQFPKKKVVFFTTTGLKIGKQSDLSDSSPETAVICAQGVCRFHSTPRRRAAETGRVSRQLVCVPSDVWTLFLFLPLVVVKNYQWVQFSSFFFLVYNANI